MKRRSFLKSLGAAGLMPALPLPSLALPAAPTVPAATYQWAEMIVRAHNSCSPAMLQRLLRVDASIAAALKSQLLKNGVISAQANAYGIHTAIKPLFPGGFITSSNPPAAVKKAATEMMDQLAEPQDGGITEAAGQIDEEMDADPEDGDLDALDVADTSIDNEENTGPEAELPQL